MKATPELPRFTWSELGRHARRAFGRTWAVSRPLLSGLIVLEVLAAVTPVLFALAVGLVVGEAKLVFDGDTAHERTLLLVLGTLGGLMLLVSLVTIARKYVIARLTDELRLHVSTDILSHLSTLDLEFFESSSVNQ